MDQRLSDGVVVFLRRTAVIIGLIFIIVAFAADMIGLSAGTRLSANQIAFGILGLILVLGGILGRRFFGLYRGFAVLVLNILVVAVIIDFLALALVKVLDSERISRRADHLNQGADAAVEGRVTISGYVPWVLWRSNPSHEGDPATIDPQGRRVTIGSSTAPDAYRVFTLGGSAMWGAGLPDSSTIASLLTGELSGLSGRPVAVTNLAQNAHVSMQEIIELMLELRAGNIPDAVVLYDGFNDVFAAYESGIAGVHQSYPPIAARIEGRDAGFVLASPLQLFLRSTNSWRLAEILRVKLGLDGSPSVGDIVSYRTMGLGADSLAGEVVEIYLRNCSLVEHLADAYGFECMFVWQPVLWCGHKELTDFEVTIRDGGFETYPAGGDPALQELLVASYESFLESRPDSVRYVSLQNFFDGTAEQVYIDFTGVHVSADANARIAAALADRILRIDPVPVPAPAPPPDPAPAADSSWTWED
jgi:hypothetical protein